MSALPLLITSHHTFETSVLVPTVLGSDQKNKKRKTWGEESSLLLTAAPQRSRITIVGALQVRADVNRTEKLFLPSLPLGCNKCYLSLSL